MSTVALPLQGIKVIEIAQNIAGPVAAEILAHMGADVIKIERPEGDDARHWGPPFRNGIAPTFLAANANKRSVAIDLKKPADVEWLIRFIGEADVVIQNLRPGALDALGLGASALTAKYPRLIYCSIWGFGSRGPLKLKPGFEGMVQAFAGLMMMNGDADGPPTRMGTTVLDSGTGMWTAMGALAGLVQREQTGRGCIVDASLFETGLGWMKGHFAAYRASGKVPERNRAGSNRVVPQQTFETATGPLIISAGNNRIFAKLAQALGHPDWATDARFADNKARVANKSELIANIESVLRTRSKGDWIDRLEAAGVPCAPIHTLVEAVEHPQTGAIDMVQPVPGDEGFALIALPLSFDGVRPRIKRAPPKVGEHTLEVRGG